MNDKQLADSLLRHMGYSRSNPIIREDPDLGVDEFIAWNCDIHLEHMGDFQWWIGMTVDGKTWHINLGVDDAGSAYAFADEENA